MLSEVENPDRVTSAEIVVGIPSYNEANNISIPVQMASRGLLDFYPSNSSVIINVDNHSTDGTKEAFLGTLIKVPKIYISSPEGVKGKGVNVHNLLEVSAELGAKAILLLDADLTSITPRWIESFLEPIYDGYDFVVPIYTRHKYDGTITKNIAYPLLRTLYGLRVRQPIAGDFGISGKLARCFLVEKTWTDNVFNFGIDIWMTTIAICRNFNVGQTFLGSSKAHRTKDPAGLGMMLSQVVGTMLQLMVDFEYLWKDIFASRPSVIYGFGLGQKESYPEMVVDTVRLFDHFLNGFKSYSKIWRAVLMPENWKTIRNLKNRRWNQFILGNEVWARILFDFAVAFRSHNIERNTLLEALIPLYHSCTLSFVNKTADMGTQETEIYLENFSRVFEEEKQYLINRWDQSAKENGSNRVSSLLLQNRHFN